MICLVVLARNHDRYWGIRPSAKLPEPVIEFSILGKPEGQITQAFFGQPLTTSHFPKRYTPARRGRRRRCCVRPDPLATLPSLLRSLEEHP